MRVVSLTFVVSALALGLATLAAPRQIEAQPLWDRVDVNLPYSVTIGDKTLQPGDYVIQQLDSGTGSSQVLLIYGDNGMKFETSAMTIPALENRTQPETRVILHHIGNDYYFDKIWVQGKDYGYEFPLPNSVKTRVKEALEPVTVAATASSAPAPAAAPVAAPPPPPPPPAPTAQPAPAVTPAPETPPPAQPSPAPETPPMPHTSAGWLMMLLGGGALSGLGAKLRRKR